MELEAEVAKLKEQNKELQDKQVMHDTKVFFFFLWTATTVDSLGLGLFDNFGLECISLQKSLSNVLLWWHSSITKLLFFYWSPLFANNTL